MYPSIAIDSKDYSHVVWADNRDGTWEIYYSTRIAVSGNRTHGTTHITWHDNRNKNWEIYYSEMHNWYNLYIV